MTQILFKRGLESNLPTTGLTIGEPYFTTDTDRFFIADSATTMVEYAIDSGVLQIANNLSDLNNSATARTNLGLGTAAVVDTGTAAGEVPVLDGSGKLDTTILPALAITSVDVAADETAQLAVTAQEGDVVIRTDESKTYIHNGGVAGTMADYTLLATPTDAVTSVAGKTGVITLDTADITGLDTALGNKLDDSQLIDDDSMATATATNIPSAESIKAYVDAQSVAADDKKLLVSANDSTAGYLEDKIVAGSNKVVVSTLNDGANESVSVDVVEANIDLSAANNTTSGFLAIGDALDEDNMVSDSAVHLATQQSIKAYVDAGDAVTDGGAF